ncbi:myo-inositol-1(or 4)-monophosphatase [Methylosinus sp. sav-2]|uniref:histidinol-phosphatase n=1 Tax=Methylosinus sp. sav-2 TaxID=2485168 RepID=UPI00047A647D|nr:histidinol-phosphatase [Methylosinus sp. sav-2]TDX63895.1 myo-inositol-1(or 4)-monophosphatase [Methylosinus sp. sav-2]
MTAVDFEKFVERLADASGEAILPFFRTSLAAEDKAPGGAFDPVTEADRAAEIAMRRLIEATFPSHGIIGEEFGNIRADAEYVWVLDPIDGTKSFICGLPLWGTLIGLQHRGRPCYGLMHQPFTRERFSGDGAAAYWRGPARHHHVEPSWKAQPPAPTEERRKLQTRPCATLAEATLMTTSPRLIDERLRDDFFRVEAQTRLSRYGGDCYAYCALAAGHVDLVIETNLNPYDIVALIPIVEGAGGVVTTWDGGPAAQGGAIIAAGDRRVHEAAMRALSAG